MKLYTNKLSPNCRKVHALAAHLGVALEQVTVNLGSGDHKKPEYLAINPNGKVPSLVDGSTKLWESNALLCYVAGHGTGDTTTWPKSDARYDILRWMFWEQSSLAPVLSALIGEKIFKPMRGGQPDAAVIEASLNKFRHQAAVLNGELASRKFLIGDTVTIADFSVGVWFGYRDICGLPVQEFGHIERWLGDLAQVKGADELAPPKM
ncbi:MAG TPA: glutathione S-transferase family protein [Kofleriaceae bacterium]|nr:glutathione S-transferase family protein [Kofleriaceae bacterium]